MEQLINTYVDFCYIWNKELFICPFKTIDEIKIPEEFCSRDLDLDSDLQYLLPRRQGPGLCATGLVSYLVTLHNELVNAVDRHTREDSRYFWKAGYVAFFNQAVSGILLPELQTKGQMSQMSIIQGC